MSGCVNMEVESGGDNIIEHKCRPEVEMPEPCEVNGTHDAQTRGGGGEKTRGEGGGGGCSTTPAVCMFSWKGRQSSKRGGSPSFCIMSILQCLTSTVLYMLKVLHAICTVMYYRPMQFKGGRGGMRERQRDT